MQENHNFSLEYETKTRHVIWHVGDTRERIDAQKSIFTGSALDLLWLRAVHELMDRGSAVIPLACWTGSPSFYLVGFRSGDFVDFNQRIGDLTPIFDPRWIDHRKLTRVNEDGQKISVFSTHVSAVETFLQQQKAATLKRFDFDRHTTR